MSVLFDENGKLILSAALQCLSRQGNYIFEAESKTYYYYNNRFYVPVNKIAFEKKIVDLFGDSASDHVRRILMERFTTKIASIQPLSEKVNTNKINLLNGVLDLSLPNSPTLIRHNKEFMFFNVVSARYDQSAICPNFLNFLDDITLGDESLKLLLQEMTGYCLVPGNEHQLAFILIGEGNNGKSVFLDILRHILGPNSTSSLSLTELGEKFKRVQLKNKLANISDEAPSGKEISSDIFKNLVSGGIITAEEKNKPAFQFKNNAKIITAANKVPIIKEHTTAVHRRLVVIPFDFQVQPENRNLNLPQTLIRESSGILNWAIEGLQRLRLNGAFTDSVKANQSKDKFIRDGDSVLIFIEECCDLRTDAESLCRDLYSAYRKFCSEKGYLPCAENEFGKRLKLHCEIQRHRASTPPRLHSYHGISLTEDSSLEYFRFTRT